MKRILVGGLLFLSVSSMSVVAKAEPNFSEGQWEISMAMKIEGVPFPMPPLTYKQCITKKDMVPQQQDKNQECTRVSEKVEGNTVSWVVSCDDKKGTVTESTGSATYAGTTFESTMHSVMTDTKKKSSTTMNITMKGKRTGECKEK